MDYPIHVVNVFSEKDLAGGNQLAVVTQATDLSSEQMQLIAKQMNYSESTFVTSTDANSAAVRIFLPASEIPFAGHPTIGTAYLLEKLHRRSHQGRPELSLELKGGTINTYFQELEGSDPGIVYMDQLPVTYHGQYQEIAKLCSVLGIESGDLISQDLHIFSPSSLRFLFVPVRSPEILETLEPDIAGIKKLLQGTSMEPYLFAPGGKDGGDFYARFFAPNSGIVEDPATGSAQAALMNCIKRLELMPDTSEVIIEQGYDQGRPSTLYNRIVDDQELKIQTGGRVYYVIDGKIHIL